MKFQIDDVVKFVNRKADRNRYLINQRHEMILGDGSTLELYGVVDMKTRKRTFFGVTDSQIEIDKHYYRKLKIDKICSKLEI